MDVKDIRLFSSVVRQLQRSLLWQQKNDAKCCGITVAQCHALMEVGAKGEISLIDLAGALGLDNSTLSRTIDGMAKSGLVKRNINEYDRRYVTISLTSKGRGVYNNINYYFDDYFGEIFASIPEEKHRQVLDSIGLLSEALGKAKSSQCCRKEVVSNDG